MASPRGLTCLGQLTHLTRLGHVHVHYEVRHGMAHTCAFDTSTYGSCVHLWVDTIESITQRTPAALRLCPPCRLLQARWPCPTFLPRNRRSTMIDTCTDPRYSVPAPQLHSPATTLPRCLPAAYVYVTHTSTC